MDGDWETVVSKPKSKKPKPQFEEHKPAFGGRGAKGKLVAGPIQSAKNAPYSYAGANDYSALNNQASAIAEFDYHIDDDREEAKFEVVSRTCAQAIGEARAKKKMTQGQLANAVGEKPSVIVDIENGSGRYVAGIINSIEKALNCKIPRGRGKKKSKK